MWPFGKSIEKVKYPNPKTTQNKMIINEAELLGNMHSFQNTLFQKVLYVLRTIFERFVAVPPP